LPAWLPPLLENVPAIWTIAVSLAIAGFQWRNLLYYQRRVIPLVQEMYERAMTKHDRELLTVLGNVLRIGKLKAFFRTCFQRPRSVRTLHSHGPTVQRRQEREKSNDRHQRAGQGDRGRNRRRRDNPGHPQSRRKGR